MADKLKKTTVSDIKKFASRLSKNGLIFENYSYGVDANLPGTSLKFFARMDDSVSSFSDHDTRRHISDSRYFGELFSEIQNNPNCSYDTLYNDLIKKDKYLPRYLSVLIKNCHETDDHVKSEIFGSRVANRLGIPTNYVIGFEEQIDKNELVHRYGAKNKRYYALASVDYLREGESISSIEDFASYKQFYSYASKLPEWLEHLGEMFSERYPEGVDASSFLQFRKDFIKSYLLRSALFTDNDFGLHNVGIITNDQNNKFRMMPNTDMEYLLLNQYYGATKSLKRSRAKKIRKTINYCIDTCPDILEEFITDLESAREENFFGNLLKNLYPNIEQEQYLFDNINSQVDLLIDLYRNPRMEIFDRMFK